MPAANAQTAISDSPAAGGAAFNITKDEIRKLSRKTAANNKGSIPKDSYVAGLQSLYESSMKNKNSQASIAHSNLELPEGFERGSKNYEQRFTGKGSGGRLNSSAAGEFERDPVAKDSGVRIDGEEWHKRTLDMKEIRMR